ncbi:hypothetical protein UlMin_025348 [Ulmus minor]
MGHRCCTKQKVKRGLWSPEEDEKLARHITTHGHGSWSSVPKLAGLQRCGKSCRLRWINYLRPDLKKGTFTPEEEQIIIDVHRILGNRWAQIAKHLPGRTDNEVKNFWNSCIKKKLMSQGLDPQTHNLMSLQQRASHKITSNIISQKQLQENPISVFSITSQISSSKPSEVLQLPPFVALPNAQPMTVSTFGHCDQNPISASPKWTTNVTPNISSSSSSSLNINCPSGSGLLDDICMWGSTNFEPFEAPRISQEDPQYLSQGQDHHDHNQQQQEKENNVWEMEIDRVDMNAELAPFENPTFDLGFVESTLMCEDLSSMEYDDLAWNY